MRVSAAMGAVLTATCFTACIMSGIANESPTVTLPDSLIDDIRTIAVAPLTTTGESEIPGAIGAKVETALEEQLVKLGFEVVPAYEYIGMWQHIADESGGFFDMYTGERDEELYQAATRRLRSEMRERFQVDALLYPEFWEGAVPFYDGMATWDGVSQVVFGARGLSGEVRALSLIVIVEDTVGNELFRNGFGLSTIEAWHRNAWLPMGVDGILRDSRLVSSAVLGVLRPIGIARLADSIQVR